MFRTRKYGEAHKISCSEVCILEREDPDGLLHKAINRHQVIYAKAETLLDSVHNAESLSRREEWEINDPSDN